MVTSIAPGPSLGFPAHLAGSTRDVIINNGISSFDMPPSTANPGSTLGSTSTGYNHTPDPATHLSGARMHLMLPQRYQEADATPDDFISITDNGSAVGGHRGGGSFAASRARAQTVSDQTRHRTYPSISSNLDHEQLSETNILHHQSNKQSLDNGKLGHTPHYLTAYPTPQMSPSASNKGITILNTNFTTAQVNPSLSGLGWEATMSSRPESPLPLPSPMPLADDQPGSSSLFLGDQLAKFGNVKPSENSETSGTDNQHENRKVSPGSKTSAFFATSFAEGLPTPPRPLGADAAADAETTAAMSSCPALDGRVRGTLDAEGKQTQVSSPSVSRNSIFEAGDKPSSLLPTRNRQRSGLGIGSSPARRMEIPRLRTMVDEDEPVFSEFSSSASRRAALSAAGVNRARSLGESSRPSKSNAIFNTSYALPPPPRSPTVSSGAGHQELPSPAETSSVFTVSPSPSPLTMTFGDRLSINESRTSHLRNGTLGIPDSRAVTMPFSFHQPDMPSSASSRLPISPVESSSSVLGSASTAMPAHIPANDLLSPHKRLTREVSNSNCNDRTKADTFVDQINVKPGDNLEPEASPSVNTSRLELQSWKLERVLGEGAFSRVWSARRVASSKGKEKESDVDMEEAESQVVAIKMMDKRICKDNDRTRISFEREVAVLKRIWHPQVVEYKSSFSTRYFNCLVLEQVSGGELFDLLQQRGNHRRMGEDFLRRVFTELCRGVHWLHTVNVVHRDLKLENIMFTVNPFNLVNGSDPNAKIPVDALPPQLVKLTDFGLARFIDPASPLLETRCGSESFAAPEIIMGMPYDGRDTDSWAVGVILFALVTCELPFDRSHCEGNGTPAFTTRAGQLHSPEDDESSRRKQLMRIARGAYDWPRDKGSEGVKRVVARLLVRDPARRSRIDRGLWDEIWMNGPGSVSPPEDYNDDQILAAEDEAKHRVLDGYVVNPSCTADLIV
ncbi:hypothetical protein QFC21_000578 [Naganishia friedmannii]|uniref:Uncharacterized protein n=1 Tax=Naganishia friedmannii TaxID=89922 RepID=A0ACC2WDG1_9TREE|nr:hypothetical protein QFC21_000578 [Naganishia friedmannii]